MNLVKKAYFQYLYCKLLKGFIPKPPENAFSGGLGIH